MTAHYPGPWYFENKEGYIFALKKNYRVVITHTNPLYTLSGTAKATGYLIAAAPDLLAVVWQVAEAVAVADGYISRDTAQAALQAIRKATGAAP